MNKKTELHIIDDDLLIHELLNDFLLDTNFSLTGSDEPEKGIEYVKNNEVALVILDLMMPGMDGFEVCRKLRENDPDLPVIMLTAKKNDIDRIVGLELGADDYLAKPFNPRELLARIKTILRRVERSERIDKKNEESKNLILVKKWKIQMDLDSRTVTRENREIDFTTTEFDLLQTLIENNGIVQSRESLMDKIRGIEFNSIDRTIDVFISKIRHKIGDTNKDAEIIKTVRGIGYIFTAE